MKFGGAFPNSHGEGLKRAAKALSFMFSIASAHARIKRLYIYQWTGGTSSTIFDSGLTDAKHRPRPGYVVVCKHLHGEALQREGQLPVVAPEWRNFPSQGCLSLGRA